MLAVSLSVLLLPGDGIGPEVMAEAERVLEAVERRFALGLVWQRAPVGGAAIDDCGEPLPERSLRLARASRALLLGAVGGPRWDSLPREQRPERGLLALRKELGLFANLRPVIVYPGMEGASALREERVRGLDLLIFRELTGGIYFSEPRGERRVDGRREAYNTMRYSEPEIEAIARMAFEAAAERGQHDPGRGRLCSVDKANVLEVSVLWRECVSALAADYPTVALSHIYVDNAAMQMALAPLQFDVLLCPNLFGDILSDLAGAITGSIGLLPSASLDRAGRGLYEPCHGAAPDIAGQGVANPVAMILSVAMMLRHSLAQSEAALAVEGAVRQVLANGPRTPDLALSGSAASTADVGRAVAAFVASKK